MDNNLQQPKDPLLGGLCPANHPPLLGDNSNCGGGYSDRVIYPLEG